jgi:hypothetical protein
MPDGQLTFTSPRLKTPRAAALAGGTLAAHAVEPSRLIDSGVYTFARAVMYRITNVDAIKMAGVFMISLDTIWVRRGSCRAGLRLLPTGWCCWSSSALACGSR